MPRIFPFDINNLQGSAALLLSCAPTLNAALRRMSYGKDGMTAREFRAMFSTLANEFGRWHPDAIERALGRVEKNEIRRAYARGVHRDERVKSAQWWADQLDMMKKDRPEK